MVIDFLISLFTDVLVPSFTLLYAMAATGLAHKAVRLVDELRAEVAAGRGCTVELLAFDEGEGEDDGDAPVLASATGTGAAKGAA